MSNINVQLTIQRFDKDLFSMDTNNVSTALTQLQKNYPSFLNDYLYNILAAPPEPDSTVKKVKMFIHDYRPIYDSVQTTFASTDKMEKEIKKGFQFVKYYFPDYQSRRFGPQYIPVNCMKNIIDDIYPETSADLPLIYQMTEAGKRLYALDQLLPETADSLKTGYTQNQLEGCYKNEAFIWNYFVQNNLLFTTDPAIIRDYMNDGPKTEALGEASPGFIGQFVGWQIVKKWMTFWLADCKEMDDFG